MATHHFSAKIFQRSDGRRALLWNEIEAIERRKNAQLAREIELALPRELPEAALIRLVRDFVRAEFCARGMVADLSVHAGPSPSGAAHPHAHVMLSLREISGETFGKKQRAWSGLRLFRKWRDHWQVLANARLAEAGHDIRTERHAKVEMATTFTPRNKSGPAGGSRVARLAAHRTLAHHAIARRNGARILAQPDLALTAMTRERSTFTRQDLARFICTHTADAAQFTAVMARVEAAVDLVRVGRDDCGRVRFSTRQIASPDDPSNIAG
jgi:ATP-dependent exoDNAse (exonuclease V) alpha subunit